MKFVNQLSPTTRTKPDQAYVSLTTLIGYHQQARQLKLSAQRKVLSSQSGQHGSRFRGRGIDFSEVRSYQPGDDIRSIDWRVSARTDTLHTKVFTEERERPCLILLDQSENLFFGSHIQFKSVSASHCAALLAWAALERGDRVGGLVFNNAGHREVRPRRGHASLLSLLKLMEEMNHQLGREQPESHQEKFSQALEQLNRTLKPGSEIFIISDFMSLTEDCQSLLFDMSRHNDVVAIQVYDPIERLLPPPGRYAVSDGLHQLQLNLAADEFRQRYLQKMKQQQDELETLLTQLRIPLIQLSTHDEPLTRLQQGLGIQQRKRGR